jgi:hypothetical protein
MILVVINIFILDGVLSIMTGPLVGCLRNHGLLPDGQEIVLFSSGSRVCGAHPSSTYSLGIMVLSLRIE